jgi:hypothetical protein
MRGSETKREINHNAQTHQWQLRITGDFARYLEEGGGISRAGGRWRRRSAVGLDGPFLQTKRAARKPYGLVGRRIGAQKFYGKIGSVPLKDQV